MRYANTAMAAALLLLPCAGFGQVVGSYDNFDCFNDTGQTAEGFEIDVEDVAPTDLTREFPSNFSATPWVIRYGLPVVTAYDFTVTPPDIWHAFDAGHKGVLITWAAQLVNGTWVAAYGNQLFPTGGTAGNGTPFRANPTLTNGESCWYYGLGNAYPSSGCEHFGISFAAGVTPGKMTYHWKVPDATNTVLLNGPLEASLPPSPVLTLPPPAPNKPPVVNVVARGPNDANQSPNEPQSENPLWGDAYWLKTTTYYGQADAVLDALQKAAVELSHAHKVVAWKLVQRPPGVGANAGGTEREAAENDAVAGRNVQVTKQFEYFKFSGAYDSETHEALCDAFYQTQAAALSNGPTLQTSCQNADGADTPYQHAYWVIDPGPGTALYTTKGNLGAYIGAHIAAYNVK
jgi:hypothetical protein